MLERLENVIYLVGPTAIERNRKFLINQINNRCEEIKENIEKTTVTEDPFEGI